MWNTQQMVDKSLWKWMKEVAIIHKTGKQSSFVDALSSNLMSVQYAPTPTDGFMSYCSYLLLLIVMILLRMMLVV